MMACCGVLGELSVLLPPPMAAARVSRCSPMGPKALLVCRNGHTDLCGQDMSCLHRRVLATKHTLKSDHAVLTLTSAVSKVTHLNTSGW